MSLLDRNIELNTTSNCFCSGQTAVQSLGYPSHSSIKKINLAQQIWNVNYQMSFQVHFLIKTGHFSRFGKILGINLPLFNVFFLPISMEKPLFIISLSQLYIVESLEGFKIKHSQWTCRGWLENMQRQAKTPTSHCRRLQIVPVKKSASKECKVTPQLPH